MPGLSRECGGDTMQRSRRGRPRKRYTMISYETKTVVMIGDEQRRVTVIKVIRSEGDAALSTHYYSLEGREVFINSDGVFEIQGTGERLTPLDSP
jgi:hypothetical protein